MQLKKWSCTDETIPQEGFRAERLGILEGAFETHHGIWLDKGTSLCDALGQISAEEASMPVGNGCATVAAQVEHVIFYPKVLERYVAGEVVDKTDWGEIWERVSGVTGPEWEDMIAPRLRLAP